MLRYTEEEIRRADQTDLVELLRGLGEEPKKIGTNYKWEAQNVWIKGCQWYSHYEKNGGGAVAFLKKYFGKTFPEAMRMLIGNPDPAQIRLPDSIYTPKEKMNRDLIVPKRAPNMKHVYAYLLQNRCLDKDIVTHFVRKGLIFEDERHNCVFVGKDRQGSIRHLNFRGTNTLADTAYKRNAAGSDDRYTFRHIGTGDSIYVFEAPIDMMAFISMHKSNWQSRSYIALCGVADLALTEVLKEHPSIQKIALCLDNDDAGRQAAARIREKLENEGRTVAVLFPRLKDWDEDLKTRSHSDELHAENSLQTEPTDQLTDFSG